MIDDTHDSNNDNKPKDRFSRTQVPSDDVRYHPHQLSDGSVLSFDPLPDRPFLRIRIVGQLKLPDELDCDWTDYSTAHQAVSRWLHSLKITMEPIPQTKAQQDNISYLWPDLPDNVSVSNGF